MRTDARFIPVMIVPGRQGPALFDLGNDTRYLRMVDRETATTQAAAAPRKPEGGWPALAEVIDAPEGLTGAGLNGAPLPAAWLPDAPATFTIKGYVLSYGSEAPPRAMVWHRAHLNDVVDDPSIVQSLTVRVVSLDCIEVDDSAPLALGDDDDDDDDDDEVVRSGELSLGAIQTLGRRGAGGGPLHID